MYVHYNSGYVMMENDYCNTENRGRSYDVTYEDNINMTEMGN
jgi:hypothetical protein